MRQVSKAVGFGTAIIVLFAFALQATGGIKDTHHDFSRLGWTGGELCVPCHTPHNANTEVAGSPLWNHELTEAVHTPYTSQTLDATPGQPNGTSKLCLSCHDGTVAGDSFGGRQGAAFLPALWFSADPVLGLDLTNDHPVSFVFDAALAQQDGELHDPTVTVSGLGSTITEDLLRDGKMECSSCHDVHVGRKPAGAACAACHTAPGLGVPETLSLRKANAGSALCLTCHDK